MKLAALIGEGLVGVALLATAAFTWRDIPPFIAMLGGIALLIHSGIRVRRWYDERVVQNRRREEWIDRQREADKASKARKQDE